MNNGNVPISAGWWVKYEEWMNFLTHGICIPAVLYAMLQLQLNANSNRERIVLGLYGAMLVALFSCSALYHLSCAFYTMNLGSLRWCTLTRALLRIADRSIIHLFIAACYTPWLLLRDNGPFAEGVCMTVWACALISIVMQNLPFNFTSNERFILFTYLAVGVVPGTFICVVATDTAGFRSIAAGGALYIVGLIFYCLDSKLPFSHAIWHCFVNIASLVHYQAIVQYLIRERRMLHNSWIWNR